MRKGIFRLGRKEDQRFFLSDQFHSCSIIAAAVTAVAVAEGSERLLVARVLAAAVEGEGPSEDADQKPAARASNGETVVSAPPPSTIALLSSLSSETFAEASFPADGSNISMPIVVDVAVAVAVVGRVPLFSWAEFYRGHRGDG